MCVCGGCVCGVWVEYGVCVCVGGCVCGVWVEYGVCGGCVVCVLLYISSRVQNTEMFTIPLLEVYPAVHGIISVCDISRTSWQQHGSVAPVADNAHTIQHRTPLALWVWL